MNIQSEISDYILSHDFVMLPGIGAFVAEYSKPYFDMNGEIVAGERTIRFNPLLRNDSDVEILQVFKEKMKISDREVQEQYFVFLDTVNQQLSTYNRYYWEGFGIILREGPDKDFQFIPFQPSEDKSNISEYPELTGKEQAPEEAAVDVTEDATPENPEGASEEVVISERPARKEPVRDESEEEVDEPEERGGNKAVKYMVFALPLALLTAALAYMVFFKPSLRENVKEKKVLLPIESDFSNEEITVDTLYIEEATPMFNEVPSEEHVVRVGIYKRSRDADKIVAFLAGKGYEAKIRPHGPFFKVFLLAETEEQANRYIKEVERLIDDTPIYERKKKNG